MKYFTEDIINCENIYSSAKSCDLFEKITARGEKDFRNSLKVFGLPDGLSEKDSIDKILDFLKEKHSEFEKLNNEAKTESLKVIPEEAAKKLFKEDEDPAIYIVRGSTADEIKIYKGTSVPYVSEYVVLQNTEVISGQLPEDWYICECVEFSNDNGIKTMRISFLDGDGLSECAISFFDAEAVRKIYRIEPSFVEWAYSDIAWMYLNSLALGILEKRDLSEDLLNNKEKRLIPLSERIEETVDKRKITPEFIAELEKLGFAKETEGLTKFGHLSQLRFKPLFEKVFNLYEDSQKSYAKYGDSKKSETLRKEITDILKSKGYEGEFPEFSKKIGEEYCTIIAALNVAYLDATAEFVFLKNNSPFDKYDIFFGKQNRYSIEYYENEEPGKDSLENVIGIVDKFLSDENLPKEEKSLIWTAGKIPGKFSSAGPLAIISLIIGFFVTVVLGILFCGVSVLFTGSLEVFNEIFLSKFWIYLLVSSLIPFGYLMIKTISR